MVIGMVLLPEINGDCAMCSDRVRIRATACSPLHSGINTRNSSPPATHAVGVPQRCLYQPGDVPNGQIANAMTVKIVDGFKIIYVDYRQARQLALLQHIWK